MIGKLRIEFALLFLAIILMSCNGGIKQEPSAAAKIEENLNVPDFNQDSAYAYVAVQMAMGPRVTNTAAHEKCAEYMKEKLSTFTKDVIVQAGQVRAHDGTILNIKNIIASFGKDNPNRIMLCTHWDSRPWADRDEDPKNHKKPVPAANDAASGVGVLLEIARELHSRNPKIGVDIIMLDAEDWGDYNDEDSWGLGSQYWSRHPHKMNYSARYGILLDMVGAKNAIFTREATSMHYAPDIMRKVWDIAAHAGYGNYFQQRETSPITDDHEYINKILNLPTIDIIHYDPNLPTGFFPYWHTTKDDLSVIDKQTLKAVGQTLLEVIFREK